MTAPLRAGLGSYKLALKVVVGRAPPQGVGGTEWDQVLAGEIVDLLHEVSGWSTTRNFKLFLFLSDVTRCFHGRKLNRRRERGKKSMFRLLLVFLHES